MAAVPPPTGVIETGRSRRPRAAAAAGDRSPSSSCRRGRGGDDLLLPADSSTAAAAAAAVGRARRIASFSMPLVMTGRPRPLVPPPPPAAAAGELDVTDDTADDRLSVPSNSKQDPNAGNNRVAVEPSTAEVSNKQESLALASMARDDPPASSTASSTAAVLDGRAGRRAARRPQCAVKWDRNLKPKVAIKRQCTSVTDRRTLAS